jgi:hypothetical protein
MQPGTPPPDHDPYRQPPPSYSDPTYAPSDPAVPYGQPPPATGPYPQSPQPPPAGPAQQYPAGPAQQYPAAQQYPSAQPYPAAPQYPGGGYGAPPQPPVPGQQPQNNTLGLLAMIFGIAGIPLGICIALLGILLGGAGVVLGILGMRRAAEGRASNRGMALAGVICGAIAGVIGIGNAILGIVLAFN